MPLGPINAPWAVLVLTAILVPALLILPAVLGSSMAIAADRPEAPAIALAAFGTTRPEALSGLENIEARVRAAFPASEIRMALTSGHVRRVWRVRAEESGDPLALRWAAAKSVLSTLADLREDGPRPVLVQSLHMTDGEEYRNLAQLVAALSGLFPRAPLLLGPPALGPGDGEPARLDRAAAALGPWLSEAAAAGAALVLMGHGNERLKPLVYRNLEERLRQEYRLVHVGTVEGGLGAEAIAERLASERPPSGRVILAPLMVVAGEHARQDMAGDGPGGWRGVIAGRGLIVEPRLTGLGSVDSWADIFVESLMDLAARGLS
jgi:sirohydrochlorin cobaltochelatase